MTFTPDMLRTIARNAGRVPKHNLANDLGISVSFLERIAREHGYDLRLVIERVPDPHHVGSAASPLPRRSPLTVHSEYVTTALLPFDLALIDALAAKHGIARARVVSRIIENARASGAIGELARLPAPAPVAANAGDRA